MAEPVRKFDQLVWPIGIFVGLLIVILVNALFIYVSVSGRDEIAPTYQTEPR